MNNYPPGVNMDRILGDDDLEPKEEPIDEDDDSADYHEKNEGDGFDEELDRIDAENNY